jgi:tRNA (uracil-5-)-methyltransferase TRM9
MLPSDNPSKIRTIGLDRSINLLGFARTAGGDTSEVVLGDVIQMPWRQGAFVSSLDTIRVITLSKFTIHRISPSLSPPYIT